MDTNVFESTDKESVNDKTKAVLAKYLGISMEDWPVCKICGNRPVIFCIENHEYYEVDKTKCYSDRHSKITIRCSKCRRKTDAFYDVGMAIRAWNRDCNFM